MTIALNIKWNLQSHFSHAQSKADSQGSTVYKKATQASWEGMGKKAILNQLGAALMELGSPWQKHSQITEKI